ncbi:uncharacterized protein LOC133064367 [Dama dama]|uniref:uncharacterized protein LOC133064367 n=1 Tax=Dama dama TaxID=30532 RepID=UPI002A366D85|nr:uncharacterized protein LOC133064367 [Dama dama]
MDVLDPLLGREAVPLQKVPADRVAACLLYVYMPDCSLLFSLLPCLLPPSSVQQASYAASSFSSVSYCVQQTKVAFTPEDGSAGQGISVSVSNSFLSRHGSLPVPSYKSVFRSYSQDFVPHSQASVQPFLPSTSSSSPHFPPVHQSQSSDLAVPPVASLPPSTLDGLLSSSQESSFHGNTVCLPSETSFTDSPQTPSVRTQHARLHTGLPAPGKPPPALAFEAIAGVGPVALWLG